MIADSGQLFFLDFTLTIIYYGVSNLLAIAVSYCTPVGIIIAQQKNKKLHLP